MVIKAFDLAMKRIKVKKITPDNLRSVRKKLRSFSVDDWVALGRAAGMSGTKAGTHSMTVIISSFLREDPAGTAKMSIAAFYNHPDTVGKPPFYFSKLARNSEKPISAPHASLLEAMGVIKTRFTTNKKIIESVDRDLMKAIWPGIDEFHLAEPSKKYRWDKPRKEAEPLKPAVVHILQKKGINKPFHKLTMAELEKVNTAELRAVGFTPNSQTLNGLRKRHRMELEKPEPYKYHGLIEKELGKDWFDISWEELTSENVKSVPSKRLGFMKLHKKTEEEWEPK